MIGGIYHGLTIVSKVVEPMDLITESWNVELVCELFTEKDAHLILPIPSRSGM